MLKINSVVFFVLATFSILSFGKNEGMAPIGGTEDEKIEFLKKLGDDSVNRDKKSMYYLGALNDPSWKVRRLGAFGLRGTEYIPKLIDVMVNDTDVNVRASAGAGLSSGITSNGVSTCTGVKEITENIDKVFAALRVYETAQSVVEILGQRFSGDKPLACCMSKPNKKRVVSALIEIEKRGPQFTKNFSGYWSPAIPQEALKNIAACK